VSVSAKRDLSPGCGHEHHVEAMALAARHWPSPTACLRPSSVDTSYIGSTMRLVVGAGVVLLWQDTMM